MQKHDTVLDVKHLKVFFHTRDGTTSAVDDISFYIKRNETFALVGESGSGKSVTALSIMRLVQQPAGRYAGGQVLLNGTDIFHFNEKKMRKIRGSRVAMIFQEPMTSLNPVFTVGNQITEAVLMHQQVSRKEAADIAVDMLDQVHIPSPQKRFSAYPHELSGGMKQRVMIAMALCCNPDLLIADEPTTALDVTVQAQILDLINELQRKRSMAILFITHDLGIVYNNANRVAVMRKGKIVETAETGSVFANPRHPYTRLLLDSVPRPRRAAQTTHDLSSRAPSRRLSIENLKVYFPIRTGLLKRATGFVKAVDDVIFDIPEGKTVALVGESGCGKTTIGKSLVQLLQPTGGHIFIDNSRMESLSPRQLKAMRKKVQIVFQDPYSSLNPRMLISEILTEGMKTHNICRNSTERFNRAKDLLHRVGLESAHISKYPHEFSGGQRQRICIARALSVDPEIIICDEATSSLDVSIQAQILKLLKKLQNESNISYLFITHNLGVVEYFADYVLVMYKGKIVERGSTSEIFDDPKHTYTKTLLAAVPHIAIPSRQDL